MKSYNRTISIIAAALIAAASVGCEKKTGSVSSEIPIIEVDTTEETTAEIVPEATYPDYPVSYPEIEEQDMGMLYEAENAVFKGSLKVEYGKDNYSGEGYVTGFPEGGKAHLRSI